MPARHQQHGRNDQRHQLTHGTTLPVRCTDENRRPAGHPGLPPIAYSDRATRLSYRCPRHNPHTHCRDSRLSRRATAPPGGASAVVKIAWSSSAVLCVRHLSFSGQDKDINYFPLEYISMRILWLNKELLQKITQKIPWANHGKKFRAIIPHHDAISIDCLATHNPRWLRPDNLRQRRWSNPRKEGTTTCLTQPLKHVIKCNKSRNRETFLGYLYIYNYCFTYFFG